MRGYYAGEGVRLRVHALHREEAALSGKFLSMREGIAAVHTLGVLQREALAPADYTALACGVRQGQRGNRRVGVRKVRVRRGVWERARARGEGKRGKGEEKGKEEGEEVKKGERGSVEDAAKGDKVEVKETKPGGEEVEGVGEKVVGIGETQKASTETDKRSDASATDSETTGLEKSPSDSESLESSKDTSPQSSVPSALDYPLEVPTLTTSTTVELQTPVSRLHGTLASLRERRARQAVGTSSWYDTKSSLEPTSGAAPIDAPTENQEQSIQKTESKQDTSQTSVPHELTPTDGTKPVEAPFGLFMSDLSERLHDTPSTSAKTPSSEKGSSDTTSRIPISKTLPQTPTRGSSPLSTPSKPHSPGSSPKAGKSVSELLRALHKTKPESERLMRGGGRGGGGGGSRGGMAPGEGLKPSKVSSSPDKAFSSHDKPPMSPTRSKSSEDGASSLLRGMGQRHSSRGRGSGLSGIGGGGSLFGKRESR